MNSRSDPYCPLLSENDDNTRIPRRNSVNSIRSTFMSTLPAKARYSVDPEAPFDVDFSKATALSQGEKEYYEKQMATLKSFEEVDAVVESDLIGEDDKEELAQQERAMKISNYANIVLLILKIYATVRSGSIAIAASTLDSVLDLMSGGVLWYTHLAMKNVNIYQYPIGKLRVQPVGILVFAAIMATLGFQVLVTAVVQLIKNISSEKMTGEQMIWLCSIMMFATLVKLVLWFYCRSSGNQIVRTYADDHYFDVVTNVIGLVAALVGDKCYWWIDPIGAILLAVYTITNWSNTVKENAAAVVGSYWTRVCSDNSVIGRKSWRNHRLWLLAEVAVIAADIPEVIGTAFALNILFRIPLWAGVLLTGCSTLLLLSLQRFGVRKLELLITLLVFVMAACFFAEISYVDPPVSGVLKGMFVPKLSGEGAVSDAIALLGALIMPHNLFLHSALVLSRKVPTSERGINEACRYFLYESGLALLVAFLINVAMISVSGTVCSASDLSGDNVEHCKDLTLNSASFLLKNVLGRSSSTIYAIALLASGQSSTITGTYAGQYIMQGFLDMTMKGWKRNLMTRCIAIAPSLVVAIVGGSSGSSRLIVIASMILSFELPFALIPLLKFSSSTTKMGIHKNSKIIITISWILGFAIIGINIYYLSTGFVKWLIHSTLPKAASVFVGIIVFPLMAVYIGSIIYLTLRKDTVEISMERKNDRVIQSQVER